MPNVQLDITPNWEEGAWCPCPLDGWDGLEVQIRHWYPKMATATLRKHTKSKVKRGSEVSHTNDKAFVEDMYDWIIQDWRGLANKQGEPYPCTRQYKLAVLDNFSELTSWIVDMATDTEGDCVYTMKMAEIREQEKNLGSGQASGEPISG